MKNMKTVQTETGSQEYREVAERAVEESLVLLKNENKALPLKKGTKVYIIGPAANSERAQCGGWTLDWNQSPDENIEGVTSIEEAFELTHREGVEYMRTKYCLRHELGLCPKQRPGIRPEPLFLLNHGRRLRLDFDCAACEMVVR